MPSRPVPWYSGLGWTLVGSIDRALWDGPVLSHVSMECEGHSLAIPGHVYCTTEKLENEPNSSPFKVSFHDWQRVSR